MIESNKKDEKWFWDIIDQSRGSTKKISHDRQIKNLTKVLSSLSGDEILQFNNRFHLLLKQCYTWDLWGAAFIINGGCSDDTFDYFRSWLIGQGKQAFYDAVADPETLKDILNRKRNMRGKGWSMPHLKLMKRLQGKKWKLLIPLEK